MGTLPLPARPAGESARSHKVFIMLLPSYHSFPPLQRDVVSICGEACSIKKSPQSAEKGAQSLHPFPAQWRSLSRYVTKIRDLYVRGINDNKIYVIVNKPVSRFTGGEDAKIKKVQI